MITNSLKEIKLVNRPAYLCNLCKDKTVLHLGATDAPETKNAVESKRFLHSQLTAVAKQVIGMDINLEMINWLKETQGINNIHYGDIENYEDYPKENFDLVIAGEILEHLSNAGKALDCIHKIMTNNTKLIITVPNAYSVKGFMRAMAFHELIHPDHTLHHSPHTLKTLLFRHGFEIKTSFSFFNGGTSFPALITNSLLNFAPHLAEGIGVICQAK